MKATGVDNEAAADNKNPDPADTGTTDGGTTPAAAEKQALAQLTKNEYELRYLALI